MSNLSTNFALPLSGSLCITDSLSHTTYVETNQCGPLQASILTLTLMLDVARTLVGNKIFSYLILQKNKS